MNLSDSREDSEFSQRELTALYSILQERSSLIAKGCGMDVRLFFLK
jgi:hypothetical protein